MMNLNSKLLILLAIGIAVIALLCVEAHPGKLIEKDEKVIKLDDDHEFVSKKLDKRAADDDESEDKPPAKKAKKKKKSATSTVAPAGDKSTTTGLPTTAAPMIGSSTTGKPADNGTTTTTGKPDASTTKKAKGASASSDDDDPDSSSMQTLIKNQRVEKKLLDKAYQSLKDYVGFVETHDKFVLNPIGASQMVSYVNALVPKYLTRSYRNTAKKVQTRFEDQDYSAPRHETKRYQFARLGY